VTGRLQVLSTLKPQCSMTIGPGIDEPNVSAGNHWHFRADKGSPAVTTIEGVATHDAFSCRDITPSAKESKLCANSLETIPLRLQRLAPARQMVALARQLNETFCIGTGGATVFFGVVGYTVASGMGTFRFRNHGSSFSRRFYRSLEEVLRREPARCL
jgi:hypothetical protein